MRILITDSDARSALAATRSLGQRGHQIFTSGDQEPSLAGASRYSRGFVRYPNAATDPDGFVAAIMEAVNRLRIEVLLPMTEVTTLLLTEHQANLPPTCRLPFAPLATVARASNKAEVMALAAQLGVPIPATVELNSAADLPAALSGLTYPVVIKPARSRIRGAKGFVSTSVSYASDEQDLRERIDNLRAEAFPVLLQERIVGPGVGLFACYDHGRPIAVFAHKRIREKPPSGGVSVLRESAPIDPAALDYATRLLEALQWHGVAMVEFKRDDRDNSLRLMEINGRFWGSLQLAIDAGVDFPALLVDLAAGNSPAPLPPYRVGVRSRWFWGDVDALLSLLLNSPAKLDLPPDHPGRWRTLLQFLKPGGRDQRDEVFRSDDLGPAWHETKRWLRGR